MTDAATFIAGMPKGELHMHLEGTIDAARRETLAHRNGITLAARGGSDSGETQAYTSLEDFLRVYYEGLEVLVEERDFHELTLAFLTRCRDENIVYAELSFDPQPHLARNVPIEHVMNGIQSAREDAQSALGIQSNLIMCVNRDRPLEEAWPLFDAVRPWRDQIVGFGLDSAEHGNPPSKFAALYERARDEGYRLTAHCDVDQEDSIEPIRQCLSLLGVERIDHGVNSLEDPGVIDQLRARNICLTVCPTWRSSDPGPRRLRRLRQLYEAGVRVTLNTDDPALFPSGYLTHLMTRVHQDGDYTLSDMLSFSRNAFLGSFATHETITGCIAQLDAYAEQHGITQ